MIEFERTFLIKALPEDLQEYDSVEMLDIYIPKEVEHPNLRIRKMGEKYEMTKKERVDGEDASHQHEYTIHLTKQEFDTLSQLEGKRVGKIRYQYPFEGKICEIDVFTGSLKGLVLVDFEFENVEEKDDFEMPDFCLADVTQDEVIAGGRLGGKSYEDIAEDLDRFGYQKV